MKDAITILQFCVHLSLFSKVFRNILLQIIFPQHDSQDAFCPFSWKNLFLSVCIRNRSQTVSLVTHWFSWIGTPLSIHPKKRTRWFSRVFCVFLGMCHTRTLRMSISSRPVAVTRVWYNYEQTRAHLFSHYHTWRLLVHLSHSFIQLQNATANNYRFQQRLELCFSALSVAMETFASER